MGILFSELQILDNNGDPASGALLNFYDTGTTNRRDTFSDSGLTSANANPVVADSNGRVGPIYGTDGVSYNVVCTESDTTSLWSNDPMIPELLTSNSLITRVRQIASNPVDYGAVGDGAADESTEVQSAIDNATTEGVVDLLGLTFRCDSAITLNTGITLRNGVLDFSNCTADEFIIVHGSTGSAIDVTSDTDMHDTSIVLASAAGLSQGDLLSLVDTQAFTDAASTRGEIVEIQSISGSTITPTSPTRDEYATASSHNAHLLTTVDDVTLDNLEILGATGISGDHDMVSLVNTRRTVIRDCYFRRIDSYGIAIAGGWDTRISGCVFDGETAVEANAIAVSDASHSTTISRCQFDSCLVGVLIGNNVTNAAAAQGIPRDTTIESCRIKAEQAVLAELDAQGVVVRNSEIIADPGGTLGLLYIACAEFFITNNTIYNHTANQECMTLEPTTPTRTGVHEYSIRILNNTAFTDQVFIDWDSNDNSNGADHIDVVEISGNVARPNAASDININLGSTSGIPGVNRMILRNNEITGELVISAGAHANATIDTLRIEGGSYEHVDIDGGSNVAITTLGMSGVDVVLTATTDFGVEIDKVVNTKMSRVDVDGTGVSLATGVQIATFTGHIHITDCQIVDFTNDGINIQTTDVSDKRIRISGCYIDHDGADTTSDAIHIVNPANGSMVSIEGNTLVAGTMGINYHNRARHLTIKGNQIQAGNDSTGRCINIDADNGGAAADDIDFCIIAGNVCECTHADADAVVLHASTANGIDTAYVSQNIMTGGSTSGVGVTATNVTDCYEVLNQMQGMNARRSGSTFEDLLDRDTYQLTSTSAADRVSDGGDAIGVTVDVLQTLISDLGVLGLVNCDTDIGN